MKNIILFFSSLLVLSVGFADNFVLINQTSHPANNKKSKIVLQWASSVAQVEESNNTIKQGKKLNPHTLQVLARVGKFNLESPQNAKYFRVLVWSKGVKKPDLLTNWVDIIPNKTYTLTDNHLIPMALMSGMGC